MRLLTASRPLTAAASAALLTGLVLFGPVTSAGAAPAKPAPTTTPTTAPRVTTTVKPATGSGTKKTGSGAASPTTTVAPPTSVKPSSRTTTPTTAATGRSKTTATTAKPSSTTKSTAAPRAGTKTGTAGNASAPGTGSAGSTPATSAAPTTVKAPVEVAIDPAERPALLVDGPASPAPASAFDLSPLTKLWLIAGGLAATALVLTLLVVAYWRRTRPVGRPMMVASAGAIAPTPTRRRARRHDRDVIELEEDVESVRVLGSVEQIGRAANEVIDRRTPTVVTSAGRWTGEVKVTTGARVTGSLVPLAAAPDNLDAPVDAAGAPSRWTGDRWSGNDPKLRARV